MKKNIIKSVFILALLQLSVNSAVLSWSSEDISDVRRNDNLNYLKKHFEELYRKDYQLFWDMILEAERKLIAATIFPTP